jgi:predicted amidophosphoribosyltransferase
MGNSASSAACYTCLGKVGAGNGIHCSHCWSQTRMQEKKAEGCEQCVIGKDKNGGEAGQCWS